MLGNITYINHQGEKIEFGKNGVFIKESDLLDYTWGITKENDKISGFNRSITNRTATVVIKGDSAEKSIELKNNLFRVMEKDVLAESPGKMVIGNYYLSCYVTESKKSNYIKNSNYMNIKLKITPSYQFWCKEQTQSFLTNGAASLSTTEPYLYYPFSYPYQYSVPESVGTLRNDHYAECDFKMVIYGPCENPSIRINGHLYEVTAALYAGEYLVIDSRENLVQLYGIDGRMTNVFNKRNKESNLFEKIPAGRSTVIWNTAAFGFDVILFQERSEPAWTL